MKKEKHERNLRFIEKWIRILDLYDSRLRILFDFDHDYFYGKTNGYCSRDPITHHQQVNYTRTADDYVFIHELGHARFNIDTDRFAYKKTFDDPKIRNLYDLDKKPIEDRFKGIPNVTHALEDIYVNIFLCNYRESMPIFLSHYKNGILKIDNTYLFFTHLEQYIYYYMVFKFILPKRAHKVRELTIQINLANMRQGLLHTAKREGYSFTQKDRERLDKYLDMFKPIEPHEDYSSVLKYNFLVLNMINLWKKEDIIEAFQHDYNFKA